MSRHAHAHASKENNSYLATTSTYTHLSTQQSAVTSMTTSNVQQTTTPLSTPATRPSYSNIVSGVLPQSRLSTPLPSLIPGSSMLLQIGYTGSHKVLDFAVNSTNSGVVVPDHKSFRIVDSMSISKFDVSQIDSCGSAALCAFEAEFTLKSWLTKMSKYKIWSKKHEEWNDGARKLKNGLKNEFVGPKGDSIDRKFNFNRLTDQARAIIRAIVTGLLDLHAEGISNNYLDNTDNYLFRKINSVVGSKEICEYNCHFLQTAVNSGGGGMSHDMKCVRDKILEIIREPTIDFPPDLQHFMDMLTNYRLAHWKETNTSLLRDHPALWSTQRKNYFWLLLSEQNTHPKLPKKVQEAMEDVFRHGNSEWNYDWLERIPPGTPFHTVLRPGSYVKETIEFFRYLRNLVVHVRENVKSQDHEDYTDPDFVEVLICELFPLCMVLLWEEMKK